MCDSFDMACRDASNALQLNIKVNSENLLPNAQKYNVGSLRIPADPSWPKIPQRKLAEDMDDVIVPPCVVTLTGTPRKSRTTVRHANSHQSSAIYTKDHVPASLHPSIYQKTSHLGHPMKRRPGCADPRFKKVTTVKSQMTSTEPPDRERDNRTELSRSAVIISKQIQSPSEDVGKIIPEKDNDQPRVTQQEAEKPGEIRGMDSIGVQTTVTEDPTLLASDRRVTSSPNDVSLAITNKLQDSAKLTSPTVKAKKLDGPAEAACKGEESFRREWSPNGGKKYAEPEVQKKYVEPEVLKKYAEPEVQRKYAEPEVHKKYAEPEVQKKYAEPEVHKKYAEPEVHKKYAEPEVLKKYAEPEVQGKYAEPEVHKKYAEPEVHKKYAEPEVQRKYVEPEVHKKYAEPEVQRKYTEPEAHKKYVEPEVHKKYAEPEVRKKNVAKEEASPNSTTGNPPADSPCLQCCQVKNAGQLLFVVESKGQGSPLGTIQIDTSSMTSCQYTSQCYNVQVPVLSYQNLQISTQQTAKSEIPSQLSLSPVLTIPSQASLNHPHHHQQQHHHHHHHHQQQRHHHDTTKGNFSRLSEVPESPMCKEETCESASRISENEEKSLDYCGVKVSRKLVAAPSARLDRKQETSFNCHDVKIQSDGISENYKAPRAQQLMSDTTDSEAYGLDVKLYSKETSASGSDYETKERRFPPVRDTSQTRKKRNYFTNEKEATKEFKFSRVNRKMKSEQNLPRSTLTKNYKNISEPQISGRDVYPLAIDDSENLPDSCDTQRTDLTNVVETTKATMSPTTNDIPVKTQQLLNKSYMEYYDKLRSNYCCGVSQQRYTCQIAMGASNVKKRRADISSDVTNVIAEEKDTKIEDINMEKLSALSNIINCNLNPALRNASEGMQTKQLYVNENMKGSSDPTAVAQSALVAKKLAIGNSADLYDSSVASSALLNKLKRKREKPVERRLLKLKSIAFFGFMMYAMIVFLPMMYTYFLYDDYEDYEDLSYIELLLDYVVSSFREAFGGFFDLIREMFFRPVSLD